jgi:hypothetical protein
MTNVFLRRFSYGQLLRLAQDFFAGTKRREAEFMQ